MSGGVIVNGLWRDDRKNQRPGVAPIKLHTGVAPIKLHTGVASIKLHTGVAPIKLHTGVATIKLHTGVAPSSESSSLGVSFWIYKIGIDLLSILSGLTPRPSHSIALDQTQSSAFFAIPALTGLL